MPSHFCKHGRLVCMECSHCVDTVNVFGENVPKLGVKSLVPQERREKDVRLKDGRKEYFNWGTGQWHTGVRETEQYCKKNNMNIGVTDFD